MGKTSNTEYSVSEIMTDFKIKINKDKTTGTIHAFIPLPYTTRVRAYSEFDFGRDKPELGDISVIAEIKGTITKYSEYLLKSDDHKITLKDITVIKMHYYDGLVPVYFYDDRDTSYRPTAKGTTFTFDNNLRFILYDRKNTVWDHDLGGCNMLFATLEETAFRTFGKHISPEFTVDNTTTATEHKTQNLIFYKQCIISVAGREEIAYIAFKPCIDGHILDLGNGVMFADKVVPVGYLIDFYWLQWLHDDIESSYSYYGYTKKSDKMKTPVMGEPMLFKYGMHFVTKDRIDTRKYNHLLEK